MNQLALQSLAQLIYDYCGLHFMQNLAMLERKLTPRLAELGHTIGEYRRRLETAPEEWPIVIELLTINETYFYREEHQLEQFQHTVLPELMQRVRERPIRVWSAACSTGEEPYTLGMLAVQKGIFLPESIRIVASDINERVLQIGRSGVYGKGSLSFRRMPKSLLEQYMEDTEWGFQIKDSVKKLVSFEKINLLELESRKELEGFDVIFCRNVLIYFDVPTIQKVVQSLYRLLSPGGYLFLGHADSIIGMGIPLQTINAPNTFYYKKGFENENIRSIGS
jgi:chemotaxis protein methyltransferase CheR